MKTYQKRIDLIAELPHGSVGAEVGVYRGGFSIEMMNLPNLGKLYLVDAWKKQEGYHDPLTDTDHEGNLIETKKVLAGHAPGGRFEIVRGSSLDVARMPSMPMLDFVYIDADHSYNAVMADLVHWSMKIKPGGFIFGHDYTNNAQAKKWKFGVIEAVADFCKMYGWEITALTTEDFASFRLERLKTIPKIIHQVWLGGSIPEHMKKWVTGPIESGWRSVMWNESSLAEVGIYVDQMISEWPKLAGVSNVVRLMLVEKFGGLYLDCDVEYIGPLDSLSGYSAVAAFQDDKRICNAIFGACANHPWVKWQLERIDTQKGFDPSWGVELMTAAPRDGLTIVPQEYFYPWLWDTPKEKRTVKDSTLLIHHWDGSWTK